MQESNPSQPRTGRLPHQVVLACLLVLAVLILFPYRSLAQSTRSTSKTKLDGTGNLGKKTPLPEFKVAKVSVRKTLTAEKDGTVSQKCKFTNEDSVSHRFLFCNMIGLDDGNDPGQTNACNLGFEKDPADPNNLDKGTWKCFAEVPASTFGGPSTLHFGCNVINLAAMGDPNATKEVAAKAQSDKFKGKKASDFTVTYADIFDMRGQRMYDPNSCKGCFGARMGTNFGAPPIPARPRSDAVGFWIMSDVPITDPYVVLQDLAGNVDQKQYVRLREDLTVPQEFPLDCPGLNRVEEPNMPAPLIYSLPLNLWDFVTMSDDPNSITPVSIESFFESDPNVNPNVIIQATPSFVAIEGGSMDFGEVTILQDVSFASEGTEVPFKIGFLDPGDPNNEFWEQTGTTIQDTVPPFVTNHSETFDPNGNLRVSITAFDATTAPLAANFWYQVIESGNCVAVPMMVEEDGGEDFEERSINTFSATVAEPNLPGSGESFRFFYNVQDAVQNNVWLGVGSLNTPQSPSKAQQKCVNTSNKNAQKIADAQGKNYSSCIKDFAKGKNGSADACTAADAKGKLSKANSKYDEKTGKDCAEGDGFMNIADNATVKAVAKDKELAILEMIFGTDGGVDGAIILEDDNKPDSKCQVAIVKAVFKCQATKWKEYNKCKKNKIKGKDTTQATTAQEVQDECVGANGTGDGVPDPKGKIAKKCDFGKTISKKCPNNVFPGCPGDNNALNDCLDAIVECKWCLANNIIDGLGRNCDEFDDGITNGSCL